MIFCFSLVACGSDSASESGEKKEDVVKFQLKDTVSTDIVDFTLEDSKFTYSIRMFGIIEMEPESLDDGFELEVYVPNSAGEYETFVYEVPARS